MGSGNGDKFTAKHKNNRVRSFGNRESFNGLWLLLFDIRCSERTKTSLTQIYMRTLNESKHQPRLDTIVSWDQHKNSTALCAVVDIFLRVFHSARNPYQKWTFRHISIEIFTATHYQHLRPSSCFNLLDEKRKQNHVKPRANATRWILL